MTIAFDFDGVIHGYSKGWKDGSIYDPISKKWVDLVNDLIQIGHDVFILSTRPKRQIYKHMKKLFYDNTPEMEDLPCYNIWKTGFSFRVMPFWEKFYKTKIIDFYPSVGICNHKAVFDVMIDDRAIQFKGSFDGLIDKILNFKPAPKEHEMEVL